MKFRVPAKALEAARLVQAKKDVRFYLCGARINKDRISAANGHIGYDHKFVEPITIEHEVIVGIDRPVPTKASIAEIEIAGEVANVRYYRFENDPTPIAVDIGRSIDGNFPDIDRVMPDCREKSDCSAIMLNPEYLSVGIKIATLFSGKKHGVVLRTTSSDKVAWMEINDGMHGKHLFLVMPMRMDTEAA